MVFMAPELIDGLNKSKATDFWALGVLSYLVFYKRYPFEKKSKNQLFYNILNGNILPEGPRKAPKPLKDLIHGLLINNPVKRLGKNINEIVNHEFFKNFDWQNYQQTPEWSEYQEKLKKNFKEEKRSSFNLNKAIESESHDPIYDVDGFTYQRKSKINVES